MNRDPKISDVIQPNAEDEHGDYWDPWQFLGLHCLSYSSVIDQNAIDVLRGMQDGLYCTDIAARAGMAPEHVELLQGIICSHNLGEYGTSPRGCWPTDREGFPALIAAWEAYYERQWGEPAPHTPEGHHPQ